MTFFFFWGSLLARPAPAQPSAQPADQAARGFATRGAPRCRGWLAMALAALGAALGAALAAASARAAGAVHLNNPLQNPFGQNTAASAKPLTFFGIADWGGQQEAPYTTAGQLAAAEAMGIVADTTGDHPAFVVGAGDNFYMDGLTGSTPPRPPGGPHAPPSL